MKSKTTKLLLSLLMLMTLIFTLIFTANAETLSGSLSLNSTTNVYISTGGTIKYYSYTPSVSGTYIFSSSSSSDTYGYLYNSSYSQLTYDDDSGESNNFSISYNLTANTTYILGVKYYSSSSTGTIPVTVTLNCSTLYEGSSQSVSLSAGQTKVFAFTPSVSGDYVFSSSGSYDTYGYLYNSAFSLLESDDDDGDSTNFSISYYLTGGETYYISTKLYNSSSSGSYYVSVESEMPRIYAGDSEYVTLSAGQIAYYYFTPSSSDTYTFYTTGSYDTYGYIYDSSMSLLESDDDDGDSLNFSITRNLTSGYTYIIGVKFLNSSYSGSVYLYADYAYSPTVDSERPTVELSSTNYLQEYQTLTLTLEDNVGVEGYYIGTSSSYYDNTYYELSGDEYETDTVDIYNSGTYYVFAEDTSGNISYSTSCTFYETFFDAGEGSVELSSVVTLSGESFTVPTPECDNYGFRGWYTSSGSFSNFTGTYTPSGNLTFYASWIELLIPGSSRNVYVSSGQTVYYQFIPETSDTYTFYSSGTYDTYAVLLDSNMNNIESDDDDGDGNNFSISSYLSAGYTYYIAVRFYSSSTSGSFNLSVDYTYSPSIDSEGPTVEYSSTNYLQDYQVLTINFEDNSGVSGYYIGTSSYYYNNTYNELSGDTSDTDTVYVYDAGTYYIFAEDINGNISDCISCTFYKTEFDAGEGSVEPSSVITLSGESFTAPIPELDGCEFDSWYSEGNGSSIVLTTNEYYPSGSYTFTALWVTRLLPDLSQYVYLSAGERGYFYFVPEYTGTYTFYSTGSYDTRGFLFDYDVNQLESNDDDGEDRNFSFSYYLQADEVYMLAVDFYNTSVSGSFYICVDSPYGNSNAPTAEIYYSNYFSYYQCIEIDFYDDNYISGYYFGTDSDYGFNSYTNLGSYYSAYDSLYIYDPGTYYLNVVDDDGNISETYSITLYETWFDAGNGSVSTDSVLTVSGEGFYLPDAYRDGYIFEGWATYDYASYGSTGTYYPTGNDTLYAVWSADGCAGDHDYYVTWSWTGVSSATAIISCYYCDEGSYVTATIKDKITKQATCSVTGTKTYTATAYYDGETFTTSKTGIVDKTAHKYKDSWEWNGYSNATLVMRCTGCSTSLRQPATVTSKETKKATCVSAGSVLYTAKANFGGKWYQSTKTKSTSGGSHNYVSIIVEATTKKDGKIITGCSSCSSVKSTETISKIKKISISKKSFSYNGKVNKPKVTVKDSKGKIIPSSYYTVKYSNSKSKSIGNYKVTITFKDKYAGKKKLSYKIAPKKVKNLRKARSGSSTGVIWDAVYDASGYVFEYYSVKDKKWIKTKATDKPYLIIDYTGKSKCRVRAYKSVKKKIIYGSYSSAMKF